MASPRPSISGPHSLLPDPSSLLPHVVAVALSKKKGSKKSPVPEIILRKNWGILGDAHAGPGIRQVSLLAEESIEKMRSKGLRVGPGDFAENITTSRLDLPALPLGTRLRIGRTALVEITQIGKKCDSPCQIYRAVGDCVMPREGIFAVVVRGGKVSAGDAVKVAGSIGNPSPADSSKPHPPRRVKVAILCASTRSFAGTQEDTSTPTLKALAEECGWQVAETCLLPDDEEKIRLWLLHACDELHADLVLTTGGTGLGPRDFTPEATQAVIERPVPGIPEAMRSLTFPLAPQAILSRAAAGVRGSSLIINLPGSPKAVTECFEAVKQTLAHAVDTIHGRDSHPFTATLQGGCEAKS